MRSYRSVAGLAAAMLAITSMTQFSTVWAEDTANTYQMNISVNLNGEKKSISPYIYGINEYGDAKNLKDVTAGSMRQGGNRYTGYNWETNYSNAGSDWHNSSDTNIADDTDGAGYAAKRLSESCTKYNIPYKLTTLQMAGYVSADKAGAVADSEAAPSSRWNEVKFKKDGALSLTPDLTDGTVYMDEYVNYLVQTLGDASTSTGMQGYSLDNEPVLWNDTHSLLHPNEVSNQELVSKSIELSAAVKDVDPKAEIFGPAFWGMLPCINGSDGENYTDPDWNAVKSQYTWYMDYYLTQMKEAEQQYGKRLLDVFDVHYYAQDCATDAARLQAARSLYDPDYQENSWLQPYFGQYFPFLTRLQESIDQYYPGTKLALTEYNLGDLSNEKTTGKSVVSALTETETLGAFADQGVYLATYWGTLSECPYVVSAINLYTNYDGKGASFGDTLVESKSEDLSKAAVFASIDGSDTSTVKTVLSNKSTTDTQVATITLDGSSNEYKSAVVYAITQDSSDIKVIDVQNDVSNNQVKVELPPLSVAQVVISDQKTDTTIPVDPVIRTETKTYAFSDLELSENNYPMIPLGDKEHLKKIIINTTVTSSDANCEWGGGGGGLCFNKVVAAGSSAEVWGNKAFSYSLGTADSVVDFDDQYTIVDANGKSAQVTASCNDTYAELQDWWRSSKNDEKGSDISVTYNSVQLVYEYDETPVVTTTTASATTTTTTTTTTAETTTTSNSEATTTSISTTTGAPDSSTTTTAITTATVPNETTTTTTTNGTTTTTTTSAVSSVIPSVLRYGDLNEDGTVSLADAVRLCKYLNGTVELSDGALANADVNADGTVNDQDLLVLVQYLARLVDTLPSA